MRYAQEKRGQKLHLVFEVEGEVLNRALCGKQVKWWRTTTNFPMGMACKNCLRAWNSPKRKRMVVHL